MHPSARVFGAFTLAAAILAAPAFAEPVVWECRIERVIVDSKSTLLTDVERTGPAGRFIFSADTATNTGCLQPAPGEACSVAFTGAIEGGGVLRLAATAADGTVDLVNIFTRTGRFIRIQRSTQWMGKQGDCLLTSGRAGAN